MVVLYRLGLSFSRAANLGTPPSQVLRFLLSFNVRSGTHVSLLSSLWVRISSNLREYVDRVVVIPESVGKVVKKPPLFKNLENLP